MVWTSRNPFLLFLIGWLCFSTLDALGDPTPGIQFVENKNQWPAHYQYAAHIPGGKVFLSPNGFTYSFIDTKRLEELHEHSHNAHHEGSDDIANGQLNAFKVEVTFPGSRTGVVPTAIGKSPHYYNYFLGSDTCHWASKAYAYSGLYYGSFYNGVDLKVYSQEQNLKYDFIVSPNADPNQIHFTYDGPDLVVLGSDGDLLIDAGPAQIIEKKPVAFQYIEGKKIYIPCHYILKGNTVSFAFPDGYDPCYELVIDPLLIFSTYNGSSADSWGSSATPGEHGTLYSTGTTNEYSGGKFPATNGAYQVAFAGIFDIAILKYDSTGSELLYATYLGGGDTDSPHSLVMNSKNELMVLGTTSSNDFPTSVTAFSRTFRGGTYDDDPPVPYSNGSDIFISRLSSGGDQLLASTLLGGTQNDGINPTNGALTRNYGDQLRGDIITDDQDNVYVSSVTASPDFPLVNSLFPLYRGGATDALLIKMNKDLSQLLWSTVLGGNGSDASHTIQFDKSGNLVVAGGTTSTNFPATSGSYQTALKGDADGWVARLANDGSSIMNATLTGTTSFDQIYFVDLNEDDEIYVYGQTAGSMPVTAGVYSNPNSGQFIQKFSTSLNTLIFSTVVGSGRNIPDISPTAFLVNECNNIYLTGWGGLINRGYWNSNTFGMPVTQDAFQKSTSGSDFYFMVLTDDASTFLYGTFLGGNQSRTHVDGGTSRFDRGGIVYHAVCSGCVSANSTGQSSSDFPTTSGAWSNINRSTNCNNAAFKFDLSSLKARIQSNSIALDQPGLNKVCIPDSIVFQNFSTGGETFEWNLGDGTLITKPDTSMVKHQYKATGSYTVWLKAIDKGTCKVVDSVSTKVNIFLAETEVQDDDDVCLDSPYQLKASGGLFYEWTSEDGSFQSNIATPVVTPVDTTRYFVTITERSGCTQKDTVQLNVVPLIVPDFEINRSAECFDRPYVSVRSTTDSLSEGDRLFFDFGDGSTSDDTVTTHTYDKDGLYNVKLVAVRGICITEKIRPIPVFKLLIPNIITPALEDRSNDKFVIQYGDTVGVTPLTYGYKMSLVIYNRWGAEVYRQDEYQNDWDGESLPAGIYYYDITVEGHTQCKSWIHLVR